MQRRRTKIAEIAGQTGYIIDPHTAVALHVAAKAERANAPMVALSTAHPAKFPEAVKSATGIDPALPPCLTDLMQREERFQVLPAAQGKVEAHILAQARAVR